MQVAGNYPGIYVKVIGNRSAAPCPCTQRPTMDIMSQPSAVHMMLGVPVNPGEQLPVQRLPVSMVPSHAAQFTPGMAGGVPMHTVQHQTAQRTGYSQKFKT